MQVTYWLVMREPGIVPGGIYRVSVTSSLHASRESAEFEAEQLALESKDTFYVLETVSIVSATTKEVNGELRRVPVYQEIKGPQ